MNATHFHSRRPHFEVTGTPTGAFEAVISQLGSVPPGSRRSPLTPTSRFSSVSARARRRAFFHIAFGAGLQT